MTLALTNSTESHRHQCEVRDWARRIKQQPADDQIPYWRKWRAEIAKHRGREAALRVHEDVMAEMKNEQ